jgi:hypothetical protein
MTDHYWPDDVRTKHLYIAGLPGYGKTSIMANLAVSDIENGAGVCVIDPKGSKEGLVNRVLAGLAPGCRPDDDLIYLSLKNPIPLDFMGYGDDFEKSLLTSDVITILKRFSFGSWGPTMQGMLMKLVPTLLEAKDTTFLDVGHFLESKKRRDEILEQVSSERRDYWKENPPSKADIGPIAMRMANFTESKALSTFLGSRKGGLNIGQAIEEGKVLLVDLSPLSEDGLMLGALMVSKIQQAIFRRDPDEEHPPFALYADEFQNFTTSAFNVIMSQARSFNLSLCLANQHPGQIKDMIDDIKGCVSSYLFFRMDGDHSRLFKSKLRQYTPEHLETLPVGKAIYIAANGTAQEVTTPRPPEPTNGAYAESIKKRAVHFPTCNTAPPPHTEDNDPPKEDRPPEPVPPNKRAFRRGGSTS